MPAAAFFSSASSRLLFSSRATRVDSTRLTLVVTRRAASRTCVATCSSMFRICVCVCEYCSLARARVVSEVASPIG